MKSYSESYKAAGVDITAGYKAVELMKSHVQKTMRPEVLGGLGGFSGAFSLESLIILLTVGTAIIAIIPKTKITITNSIKVNPFCFICFT